LPRLTNGPAVRFVAVDIHDSSDTRICNLYPAGLFAEQIRTLIGVNKNCFVFAPDKGSTWRANQVAEELHVPILIVNKTRHRDNSCTLHTVGSSNDFDLHECVKNLEFGVLVDDIVASGQTLRAAVSFIKNLGIKHIIAVITHTVIAPDEKLLNDIDVWITTNTHTSSFKSVQVDIAPFVVTEITRLTRK
jgi:phosphoribosylpyrophosphate synthetase